MIKSIILTLIKIVIQVLVICISLESYTLWPDKGFFIIVGLYFFFNLWQDIVVSKVKSDIIKDKSTNNHNR